MNLALLILFGTLLTEAWGQGIYHLLICIVVAICYFPEGTTSTIFEQFGLFQSFPKHDSVIWVHSKIHIYNLCCVVTFVRFLSHHLFQYDTRNLSETKIKFCQAKIFTIFQNFLTFSKNWIQKSFQIVIVSANVKMQYSDKTGNFVPFGNFPLEINLSIVYVISCLISKYWFWLTIIKFKEWAVFWNHSLSYTSALSSAGPQDL